jgi:hypothetical protein
MVEYRKNAHAVWDVKYHVIWVTKYRYKVLRGEMSICFFCTPTVVDFEAVDASKFFQNPKKQDISIDTRSRAQ